MVSRINLLFGGIGVGWISFVAEGVALPENKMHTTGSMILNMRESKFQDILDIVRNEAPLFMMLNTDLGIGAIRSSEEPVGETELV